MPDTPPTAPTGPGGYFSRSLPNWELSRRDEESAGIANPRALFNKHGLFRAGGIFFGKPRSCGIVIAQSQPTNQHDSRPAKLQLEGPLVPTARVWGHPAVLD